jgi:hypothetical protein
VASISIIWIGSLAGSSSAVTRINALKSSNWSLNLSNLKNQYPVIVKDKTNLTFPSHRTIHSAAALSAPTSRTRWIS